MSRGGRHHQPRWQVRSDLINFSSNYNSSFSSSTSSSSSSSFYRSRGRRRRPFDRRHYVLANFRRIVVRPPSQSTNVGYREYGEALRDADVLVSWDLVELVEYDAVAATTASSSSSTAAAAAAAGDGSGGGVGSDQIRCPICLDAPAAPKATQCGHVFCFPCILQYLDYGDADTSHAAVWRKCPVCSEPVERNQLKSAHLLWHDAVHPGQQLRFRLARRPRDSIMAVWHSGTHDHSSGGEDGNGQQCAALRDVFPEYGTPDSDLCRYNVTYDVGPILQREREELQTAAAALESDLGRPATLAEARYIVIAQQEINKREVEWREWAREHLVHGPPPSPQQQQSKSTPEGHRQDSGEKEKHVSATKEAFGSDSDSGSSADEQGEGRRQEGNRGRKSAAHSVLRGMPKLSEGAKFSRYRALRRNREQDPDFVFYYQLDTGQSVFLHPIDSRMLVAHHGAYRSMPPEITVRAIECERFVMDDHLRRKYGFLRHVPLYSDIWFVECDMNELLPRHITRQFEKELRIREHRRRERARRELEEDMKIRQEEEEERRRRFDEMERREAARREAELSDHTYPSIDSSQQGDDVDTARTATAISHMSISDHPSHQGKSRRQAPAWGIRNIATAYGGSPDLGYMPSLEEAFGNRNNKGKGKKGNSKVVPTFRSSGQGEPEQQSSSGAPPMERGTEQAEGKSQRKQRKRQGRRGKVLSLAEL